MPHKRSVLKTAIYVVIALILAVLESTPGLLSVGYIRPALVFAFAVVIAIFEGEFYGGIFAIWAGLLFDFFSTGYFFYNTLMLFIGCVIVGLIVNLVLQPTLANSILFTLAVTAGIKSILYFFTMFIRGYEGAWSFWFIDVLCYSVYTAVFAVPFYFLVGYIHRKLEVKISV